MSIITIITDPGIGGTFLTWSLEWLSGKNRYFYFLNNDYQALCPNPLTGVNAHNYGANHPRFLDQLKQCYEILKSKTTDNHFVYFHNLPNNDNSRSVNQEVNKIAVNLAFEKSEKCVFLKLPKERILYNIKHSGRGLTYKIGSTEKNKSFDEQNNDFIEYFFAKDHEYWKKTLNLNDIWDHREFLALNLRPFDPMPMDDCLFSGRDYFRLLAEDCHFCLDRSINDVFQYLDISIDKSRWDHWLKIYNTWKTYHYDRMRFSWYFEDIINAILNGTQMDLTRFDLDLYREAVIQHILLYQHNLNLRTYNLVKFNNTRQLHDLLETNTQHPLEKIY